MESERNVFWRTSRNNAILQGGGGGEKVENMQISKIYIFSKKVF